MLFLRSTQVWSFTPNKRSKRFCGIISGGSARSYPAQLMLRCTFSPCDSCATPICSEWNRDLAAHLRRQNLVDRGAAGAASCIGRSGHQSAHCGEVPIALPVESGSDVIDSAKDMNVFAHRKNGGKARR